MRSVKLIDKDDIIEFLEKSGMNQTQFINTIGINHKYFIKIMNGEFFTVRLSERIRKYIESNSEEIVEKITLIVWKTNKKWNGFVENHPGTNIESNNFNNLLDKFKEVI